MIGFLVGTACLVALIKVVRGRRYGYGPFAACGGHGSYGHFGGHGCDDAGWGHGRRGGPPWARGGFGGRGGFGARLFLRGLFQRLETSPGQEKVILDAFEELKAAGRNAKDEARAARADFAKAMRGESFDEDALGGATARVEGAVDSARKAGISAFAKVHGILDEHQRARLADLIEHGPGHDRFGRWRDDGDHPYRHSV